MAKKLRLSAETIPELRDFLAGAVVDMGCRPVALRRGDRYATTVIAEDAETARLSRARAGSVRVEVIEEVRPAARLRMMPTGDRFAGGAIPHGFGVKE